MNRAFRANVLLALLLIGGCAKATKTHVREGRTKRDDSPVKAVDMGAGDTTFYQTAEAKEPSFTLAWDSGGFDAAHGTVDTGKLKGPHGTIYQDGKAVSTYRADVGKATRAPQRLNMDGRVVLQSTDKSQTLNAAGAEYRGDSKLVRATGGVVATGPFGTLSGVPEVWATPDLRLIGTPDMVSKKLHLPVLAALAATTTVGEPVFQGRDFKLENIGSASGENLGAKGQRLTIVPVKGKPLIITILSRDMSIRSAGPIVVMLDPKGNEVRHLVSQGAAHVVQTEAGGTTTMDGDGAEYDSPAAAETDTLEVGGRVTLTSVTRRKDAKGDVAVQTTVSKGDRGRALLLAKPPKDGDALKSATLDGNVSIDSKGSDDDTFNGVGERLVYTPRGTAADVDLTGRVTLTRISRGKDGEGKPTTQTVVSRAAVAHALLDPKAGADSNPLRTATLTGGVVAIDVSGSNGETFKATGDKVVYTATSGGDGEAVMTGDLKFSGDAPSYLTDVSGADTATVTIGKGGWKTVHLDSSTDARPITTIKKPKSPVPTTPPAPKKKKGGKP